ncbi:MAG: Flp family type IVb pilin [Gemmatimonadales bacterium]
MSELPLAGRRGAASVEYIALAGLIGLLIAAGVAALVASPPRRADRELGEMLARRIACTPRYPVPCGRNPLASAYGFSLGKLVRYLAPAPVADGGELPVDFRYCRQPSCAAPGADQGLTASRRRVTEFTSVEDRRTSGGLVRITYWLYRPGIGWERLVRSAGPADTAAPSRIRLNLEDNPALVPLETLPGRDHYRFPPGEEPPWQWALPSRPPT